jgi:flagella basal body P-ring formation protein FlgA
VDRAYLHWTLKAGIRAIMNLWSVKRTLKPGESLDLESDYEMIRE